MLSASGGCTVGRRVASARHDAVAQLNDLRHGDDALRVIALVGEENEEVEDVRNELVGVPATIPILKRFLTLIFIRGQNPR